MKFTPQSIDGNETKKPFLFLMILIAGFVLGVMFTIFITSSQTDSVAVKESAESNILASEENFYHDELMLNALQSMRVQAELSYNNNNFTYSAVCTDSTTKGSPMLPVELNDLVCRSSDTAFVIYAPYHSQSNYYNCIDSTGVSVDLTEPPNIIDETMLSCY